MIWSFSKSNIFRQCQRRWYFMDIMASHGKKNKIRRQAFLLKQLQSIHAWRGNLVDKVIEKKIIPMIRYGRSPAANENEIIDFMINLMEKQIDFGINQRHLEEGMTKTKAEDIYCAFYDIEYNGSLDENKLENAKNEALISIKNLIHSELVKEFEKEKPYLIPQRPLSYAIDGNTIRAVPDLIALYRHKPPTIVDWKVHIGSADYRMQLGIYAFVLANGNTHSDFKSYERLLPDPTKYRLIECQLLNNKNRFYSLTEADSIEIEDKIYNSMMSMEILTSGQDFHSLDFRDFDTPYSEKTCNNCQFKKICWEENGDD